ncbi:MAG TPA: trigger factor [Candidatus Faeciplasma pullistercoris]|uniref:Trigger factor n=1 Tax=Candidatus Faeciplasma pullistercoris TaxID=2840800 RepID=A0A9D1KKR5_9FIRM|nr:trigger factor [Candidatus Faeciplasma pullistercoris]
MLKSKNQVETNKYELEIEVSAEAFEDAIQKAYLKNKSKITVPGFRPGKAPRKVIEKEYGESVFFEDAVNDVYGPAIEEAVKEAELTLVTAPDVEVTDVSKENGVKFKATCTTKPVIDIKDYKGIKVTKNVNAVTDEDVEHEIGHMLERNSRTINVDDRACQNGDDVVIDFEGFKDGVAFDGGKAEKFTLKLGSGQFIPGFEDQVVGHNVGDEFDINVTFPEDYQAKELAGAPVVFKIKLHEIKTTELPTLDDDFVKDTSDFNTVDELRADVRKKLEETAEKNAQSEVESKIMDEVISKVEGEIPEVMYDNKVNEMIDDLSARLSQQGIKLDMYLKFTGLTMDSLKTTYKEQAEKQVKLRLALEKIVELENIQASDEEVEKEYASIGEHYNMPVETVKQYISVDGIKQDVCVGKAVDLVKAEAVID